MMTEKLEPESLNDSPRFYLDGDIYPFAWSQAKSPGSLDTSGLPSLDYALHLFHVVRFHLGQAYRFFDDEADFVSRMHDFYKSPPDGKIAESGFWFVQFLMVLALGNAFLSRPRHQKDPPGSKYFTRAMAAMPNYTSTGQDSLVAIEALALVGLYLYSIDHREAAHVHVSFLPTGSAFAHWIVVGWSRYTNRTVGGHAYPTPRGSSWGFNSSSMSESLVVAVHHGPTYLSISGSPNDHERQRYYDFNQPSHLNSAGCNIQPPSKNHEDVFVHRRQ